MVVAMLCIVPTSEVKIINLIYAKVLKLLKAFLVASRQTHYSKSGNFVQKKVLFNIASEASSVYILSGQKLIKMSKRSILASFWKPEACGQTVLPDRSVLIGQKLMENAKIEKFKCDILSNFQTM